jgi:hypothetical protein
MDKPMRLTIIKSTLTLVSSIAPLMGQVSWGSMEPPLVGEPLKLFSFHLSNNSISLVIFDSVDGSWRDAIEKLSTEDSKLSELPLVFRLAGTGVANELYGREGWAPEQRWALMDWNAKVHSSGNSIPTPKELADALDSCGAKTTVQRLRDFVALNPGSVETRMALLSRLSQIASRRTAAILGMKEITRPNITEPRFSMGDETGFSFSNMPTEEEYASPDAEEIEHNDSKTTAQMSIGVEYPPLTIYPKELSSQQDDNIWSEYLSELYKLFQNDHWTALSFNTNYKVPHSLSLVSPLAKYSPTCSSTFAKLLPRIEDFLKKFPGHGTAWQVWIAFTNASGRDIVRTSEKLLEELTPLPWATFDWPPYILQDALFKRAVTDKDWIYIIRHGSERWDGVLTMLLTDQKHTKNKPDFMLPLMNEHLWKSLVAPLLEAYLAQANLKKAQDIINYWKLCDGWGGAFLLAAKLAEKYKYSELAKTWSSN